MQAQQQLLRSILLKRIRRHSQYRAQASLTAAAFATSAIAISICSERADHEQERCLLRPSRYSAKLCECETSDNTPSRPTTTQHAAPTPKPISRFTLLLYNSKLYPHSYLPVPRILAPNDPLFTYPELKRGLLRRRNDEEKVKQILSSPEVMEARKNRDQAQMNAILEKMNSVVYGEGITPQMREDFLMQYGCTGYTDAILQYLVEKFGHRGIIEVGAGNGQWAKALSDHYEQTEEAQQSGNSSSPPPKAWKFILASDNMAELPLSPKVYNKNTVPAKKYFFDVQRASHIDAVQGARGRALLLVYPPPGSMALETVLAYLDASPGYVGSYGNDTVVYVGEGRGGANADDAFFDYFLGSGKGSEDGRQWVLQKVMDVHTCPGGKGYEKMFVFQRK